MTNALARGFAILEYLAIRPEGAGISAMAQDLDILASALHRSLAELSGLGYVRQDSSYGIYHATTKLAAQGLGYLSASGIVDTSYPILDRLAQRSGELVRLCVVDDNRLTWVAKAQGAKSGLKYDPDMGREARLSCSASGHSWLASMDDEEALMLVAKQGFGKVADYGINAPTTTKALLGYVQKARKRGYSVVFETNTPGANAMAAPVISAATGKPIAIISIAGPTTRFTESVITELAPALLEAAGELGRLSLGSPSLKRRAAETAKELPRKQKQPAKAKR